MSTSKDILSELQQMGSPLADLPRNMPYKVPDRYFENLPYAILDHQKDNIRLKHEPPYSVPQGYFEELPEVLLKNIKDTAVKPRKIALYTQWAAAAVLMLIVTIGGYNFLNYSSANSSIDTQLAQLSESTLNEYIENNISDFDTETIQNSYASNKDIETLIDEINENDIINYLNDAGWQQETLYN